eukprot:GGOE01045768.1.p1 GENE.GGOE01045768.1~~GGOE01045768.1.p1  ORF type:complete len:1114 (+),score=200.84 GGOE01045768.1:350-3343(+)
MPAPIPPSTPGGSCSVRDGSTAGLGQEHGTREKAEAMDCVGPRSSESVICVERPPAQPPSQPTAPEPKDEVEARVIQRLKQALAKRPRSVTDLRALLGNPSCGGCKADCTLLADWKSFVLRNNHTFAFDDSGSLPVLSLQPPKPDATTSSAAHLPPPPATFPPPPKKFETIVMDCQAPLPSGVITTTTESPADIEARVVLRLEAKLANGPISTLGLMLFLNNKEMGGSEADRMVVTDWEAFVAKHPDKFCYDARGRLPKLSLVSCDAQCQSAATSAPPAPEEVKVQPGVSRENAAKEPTAPHTARNLAAVSLRLKGLVFSALKSCASFPMELDTLLQAMEKHHSHFAKDLEQLGYRPGGRHQFKHFVQLTLLSFARKLPGVHMVQRNGSIVLQSTSYAPASASHLPCSGGPLAEGERGKDTVPPVSGKPRVGNSVGNSSQVRRIADLKGLQDMCQGLQQLYGRTLPSSRPGHLVLACRWAPECLLVATPPHVFILDVAQIGSSAISDALNPFFACPNIYTVMHDLRSDVAHLTQLRIHPASPVDTQLAYELLTGALHSCLCDVVRLCKAADDPVKQNEGADPKSQEGAASDLLALALSFPALMANLGTNIDLVVSASQLRAKLYATADPSAGPSHRLMSFDLANSCRLASYELLNTTRPRDVLPPCPMVIDNSGTQALLSLLPHQFQPVALRLATEVTHIALDVGRRPMAFCGGRQTCLAEDGAVVRVEDVNALVEAVGAEKFGADSRAALPGSLHRISAIRSSCKGNIAGLTLQAVRHVTGVSFLLSDVLLGIPSCSVLVIGDPGSGKTTALRDIACLLSQWQRVMVVDTSNDIGGDGDQTHPSLGKALRIAVPSLDRQALAMAECVRRDHPDVMVVDELWRKMEVDVARVAKQSGVRVIAGVQGTLQQLVRDRQLSGLLGGVEYLSPDGTRGMRRIAEPVFDCVVELRCGALGKWVVISNAAEAVDCVACGKPYPASVSARTRDPATGMVRCFPA